MRSVSRNVVAQGEPPASVRPRTGGDRRRRGVVPDRAGGLRPIGRHRVEAMLRALGDDDDRPSDDGSQGDVLDDGFDEAGFGPPENLDGLRAYMRAARVADATLAGIDEIW